MRVLRRSAGWRRTAERTPEVRPARKWKPVSCMLVISSGMTFEGGVEVDCLPVDDLPDLEPFDISSFVLSQGHCSAQSLVTLKAMSSPSSTKQVLRGSRTFGKEECLVTWEIFWTSDRIQTSLDPSS
jgi:hypothetical protein